MPRQTFTAFAAFCLLAAPTLADEIIVPDDIPSFSVALQAAQPGDTITLRDGLYTQFPGFTVEKQLTIRSSDGADNCVIDLFGTDRCLHITTTAGGTILEGLTIRGGGDVSSGGGILAESFITIDNCIIEDNEATTTGGGLDCLAGATVRNTVFRNNACLDLTHGDGGGAYMGTAGTYLLENCDFEDNFAANTGGGLRIDARPAQITNCRFERNRNTDSVDQLGGAFFARSQAQITFDACYFADNSTEQRGGAIATLDSGTLITVRNSLFLRNNADIRGGAIAMNTSGDVVVINSSFADNTAPAFASVSTQNAGSTATLRNCVFWNATPPASQIGTSGGIAPSAAYCVVQGGYAGTGNLDLDPLFEDAANNNLRLTLDSPAIDAANTVAYTGPLADYDGLTRGVDVPDKDDLGHAIVGPIIDMGAHEYQSDAPPLPTCPSDIEPPGIGNNVVNIDDLLRVISDFGPCE